MQDLPKEPPDSEFSSCMLSNQTLDKKALFCDCWGKCWCGLDVFVHKINHEANDEGYHTVVCPIVNKYICFSLLNTCIYCERLLIHANEQRVKGEEGGCG